MQKKNCYALFIGINQYENPQISSLNGCVNDAERLLAYIQKNVNTNLYDLHIKTLFTDSPNLPTRQNIVNSIRHHFGKASQNDKVLLFYAGHGSTEKAPAYFGEADGNFQTLVPCDARMPNSEGQPIKNILDKELRYLFSQLQQAEIIFIQDSCHATGSTRYKEQLTLVQTTLKEVEEELAAEEEVLVEIEIPVARYTNPTDYEKSGRDWLDLDAAQLALRYTAFKNAPQTLQLLLDNIKTNAISFETSFPIAKQIHLAACDKHQYAYELPKTGGIFTTKLLEVLEASNNSISYQDVFNRIRMSIGGLFDQTPDLYVHNEDYKKRHEVFLGDLLQHQDLVPQRDIDVFNGFSPVVSVKSEWQIKSGELDLLPSLDGKIKSIPIEVFPIDQQPKGLSNAIISYVTPNYSLVEFTTATFDRDTYRNKLYAMIPPQYLRRWRVSVAVEEVAEKAAEKSVFYTNLESGIKKDLRNLLNKGPHVKLANNQEESDYTIEETSDWYQIFDKNKEAVLQLATKDNNIKEATKSITNFLFQQFNNLAPTEKKAGVKFYFSTASGENTFSKFKTEQAAIVNYYDPFINWTTVNEAEYLVKAASTSFAVYLNQKSTAATIPIFQKTTGQTNKDGFSIILSLQKMCKWRTVLNLNNKLQLAALAAHQFEFEFKLYHQIATKVDEKITFDTLRIQSWNKEDYSNIEKGEIKPLQDLMNQSLHFLPNTNQTAYPFLSFDLNIKHLKGNQNVYVSTLLLDSNFAVLPLQEAMGSNLLPPQTAENNSRGTLQLNKLELHKPDQMKAFPKEITEATFYIKIVLAYKRFDISGLLQDGLPAFKKEAETTSRDTRATIKKPPKTEDTGAWMAFTIPIVVQHEK